MSRPSALTVDNLTKRFDDIEAVLDVTAHIAEGEIVGFVGPNGAGKTTTIAMIMGQLRPTAGRIAINGVRVLPERAHRTHRSVGFVAGDMALPDGLTADQYLRFTAHRNGRDVDYYNHLVKLLRPVLTRPLTSLSRGNKQKIALLAALQHKPRLLIMDEPTTGLDPLMQDAFLGTVKHAAGNGTTVLMSSHILSEVSTICNRVIFMRSGRFILDKPMTSIIEQRGKQVRITSSDVAKLVKFLPEGCSVLERTPSGLLVVVSDTGLKPFLRWLVSKNFTDVTIENRDLDDIFHELYRESERGMA